MMENAHSKQSGKNLKIAVIVSRFNKEITEKLCEKTYETLIKNGVSKKDITIFRVPGALELPFSVKKIAQTKNFNAIIALGVIIRGETPHFDHVSRETYAGLMKINLETEIPIIFGVLTVKKEKHAKKRIKKGVEFAETAIEMANFVKTL